MTLRLCLMSIQSLLASPDASSPQDSVVAEVYTYDRQGFNNEAKLWTDTYANLSLNAYVDSLFEN
jgi:ubiquitin-conjugating enzyme (huntingtin interacting protein 2)